MTTIDLSCEFGSTKSQKDGHSFLLGFIKSTDHRPTVHTTTDPPTHRTQYQTTRFYFKDSIIKNIFILQKVNTAGKI